MGTDLVDIQLISKFNKGIRILLCATFSKYAWVITITNAFQKTSKESNCKPKKICVDKASEFYNRSTKSFAE